MSLAADVLRVLADLAPGGVDRSASLLDVTSGGRPLVWMGDELHPRMLFTSTPLAHVGLEGQQQADPLASVPTKAIDRETLRRLAGIDALHREENLLRAGFGWLTGTVEVDGSARRVLHPLVSVPIRVASSRLVAPLQRIGDPELSPLIPPGAATSNASIEDFYRDEVARYRITTRTLRAFPHIGAWLERAAADAGFEISGVIGPANDPSQRTARGGVAVVAGTALYVHRDIHQGDLATALTSWANVGGIEGTALASVLAPEVAWSTPPTPVSDVPAPLPLTEAQRTAVHRAGRDAVTVVSGPPGTGKSHTVCAIALDAVAAGRSVLVATQTVHAADVLTDALAELPGPSPVVFGGSRKRTTLAAELAGGLAAAIGVDELRASEAAAASTAERAAWLRQGIADLLTTEQRATRARGDDALAGIVLAEAPGLADPDVDLAAAADAVVAAAQEPTGWWSRRRQRRAERLVRRTTGARPDVPLSRLARAVDVARDRRSAAELASRGGTHLGAAWDELVAAEREALLAAAALLTDRSASGPARSRRARTAVAELATALRAGRTTRRHHLQSVDATQLLAALPLWVGTVRDIEDLLPARPGLFDLVILDEASQLDLPRAALALLRGRRAVVVGDPAQLRHVSFVADVDIERAVAARGLSALLNRLDVRRQSTFDAAAGVAPVLTLDEHFRSAPHLIEFSARRFYPTPVHLATRHPCNDRHDVIDTVLVDPAVDDEGVHVGEVAEVERTVRTLAHQGWRSIGVVTPFRAQADALEAMLLDRFPLEEIEHLGLRVGTVHAFQGAERDVVIVSLALAPDDPAGRRRFVEDPHLFNVMVTRARERLVVVTSLTDPPEGLVADYLAHAETTPGAPPQGACDDPWTETLAEELGRSGLTCRVGYPVGRWTIDLVLGDGEAAVGVETCVHPRGPHVHVERHLQLRRAGWRLLEAYPSRFDDDPVRAAVAVAAEAGAPPTPSTLRR